MVHVFAGAAIKGAGSILGGIGASRGRQAQRSQMKMQEKSLRRQIGQTRDMYDTKLGQFDTMGESLMSTQQQRIGLSGVSTEGSPLLVQAETEENLAQDRSMIEQQRDIEIEGLTREMKSLRKARKQSKSMRGLNRASSILSGASDIMGMMPTGF